MNLETYIKNCPTSIIQEIEGLIEQCNFDENFSWDADCFFVGRNEKAIIGVVVYAFIKCGDEEVFPRCLHIIINKPYRRTRQALLMLIKSELELSKMGYKQIIVQIALDIPNRDVKKKYTEEFGYKKYAEDNNAEFFVKNIGE